jgi:hypothetical protein
MTSGYRNSAGVDFDSLFDPYVQGTKPAATGYRTSDGVDLNQRFAPITFGTKGPDVSYRLSGGADASTLWAAIGTASYGLPIQGNVYSQNTRIAHSSSGFAALTFQAAASGWSVSGSGSGTLTPAAGTRDSGSLPAGAATVKYSASVSTGAGGTVSNGASTPTAVGSSPSIAITQSGTGTGAGNDVRYLITVIFYNSGGSAISTTTFYFDVSYEGSA